MSTFNQTTQSFNSNNTTLKDVMMSGDLSVSGELNVAGDLNVGGAVSFEDAVAHNAGAITSTATIFELLSTNNGTDPATNPTTINIGSVTGTGFTTWVQSDTNNLGIAANYTQVVMGGSDLAVGTIPSIVRTGANNIRGSSAPAAVANIGATATLTPAQIMTGIVQVTTGGVTVAYVLPQRPALITMFNIDVAAGVTAAQVGDSIEWTLLNLDATPANTATLSDSIDGHSTVVGGRLVSGVQADDTTAVSSGRFLTRLTNATAAAATSVTYRLA
jgi:hypothetical protein